MLTLLFKFKDKVIFSSQNDGYNWADYFDIDCSIYVSPAVLIRLNGTHTFLKR